MDCDTPKYYNMAFFKLGIFIFEMFWYMDIFLKYIGLYNSNM